MRRLRVRFLEWPLAPARLARFARPALVNGAAGFVVTRDERPASIVGVIVRRGKIVEVDVVADPGRLQTLDLAILDR